MTRNDNSMDVDSRSLRLRHSLFRQLEHMGEMLAAIALPFSIVAFGAAIGLLSILPSMFDVLQQEQRRDYVFAIESVARGGLAIAAGRAFMLAAIGDVAKRVRKDFTGTAILDLHIGAAFFGFIILFYGTSAAVSAADSILEILDLVAANWIGDVSAPSHLPDDAGN
ncbi:MAG: hypothetical protein RLO08_00255 [Parvibaculaceae bacterium]